MSLSRQISFLAMVLLFVGAGCVNRSMIVQSEAMKDGEEIPHVFTCDGENINPPLELKRVPASAKSLAILVEDRDAPNGRFVHWTVWNINPAVTRIDQGSVPAGARVGMTDFGRPGYGGPCPPDGRHNYRFTVFALDQTLTLPMRATVAEFDRAIKNHIIGQAVLTASYKRVSYGL